MMAIFMRCRALVYASFLICSGCFSYSIARVWPRDTIVMHGYRKTEISIDTVPRANRVVVGADGTCTFDESGACKTTGRYRVTSRHRRIRERATLWGGLIGAGIGGLVASTPLLFGNRKDIGEIDALETYVLVGGITLIFTELLVATTSQLGRDTTIESLNLVARRERELLVASQPIPFQVTWSGSAPVRGTLDLAREHEVQVLRPPVADFDHALIIWAQSLERPLVAEELWHVGRAYFRRAKSSTADVDFRRATQLLEEYERSGTVDEGRRKELREMLDALESSATHREKHL